MNRRQFFARLGGFFLVLSTGGIRAALPASIHLPPLPDCLGEWPVRYDLVFVVRRAVWNDYTALREKWDGCTIINGFHQDCEQEELTAISNGDARSALHWRAVQELSVRYSHIVTAAIKVDDHVFREIRPGPDIQLLPDEELKRVVIGSA